MFAVTHKICLRVDVFYKVSGEGNGHMSVVVGSESGKVSGFSIRA